MSYRPSSIGNPGSIRGSSSGLGVYKSTGRLGSGAKPKPRLREGSTSSTSLAASMGGRTPGALIRAPDSTSTDPEMEALIQLAAGRKPPVAASSRIRFGQSADLAAADAHAISQKFNPLRALLREVVQGLVAPFLKDPLLQARVLFRWVAENIAHAEPEEPVTQDPEEVLARRSGTAVGLSQLFEAMATMAGITVTGIKGTVGTRRSKPPSPSSTSEKELFRVSQSDRTPHRWTAIMLSATWQLLDVSWAAGVYNRKHRLFKKKWNSHYWMPTPEEMIVDHLPSIPRWALLHRPCTDHAFERQVVRWPPFFRRCLYMVSHADNGTIDCKTGSEVVTMFDALMALKLGHTSAAGAGLDVVDEDALPRSDTTFFAKLELVQRPTDPTPKVHPEVDLTHNVHVQTRPGGHSPLVDVFFSTPEPGIYALTVFVGDLPRQSTSAKRVAFEGAARWRIISRAASPLRFPSLSHNYRTSVVSPLHGTLRAGIVEVVVMTDAPGDMALVVAGEDADGPPVVVRCTGGPRRGSSPKRSGTMHRYVGRALAYPHHPVVFGTIIPSTRSEVVLPLVQWDDIQGSVSAADEAEFAAFVPTPSKSSKSSSSKDVRLRRASIVVSSGATRPRRISEDDDDADGDGAKAGAGGDGMFGWLSDMCGCCAGDRG